VIGKTETKKLKRY